jgi:hypothetical protein
MPVIVVTWALAAAAFVLDELVVDLLALEPQPASASVAHAAPAPRKPR